MAENWIERNIEVTLGASGHGGFCVARHEGRVMFVRHGLPGEIVLAHITEDRGGSFCRADAVEIIETSHDRVPALCPISGPGGSGCCDYSHATLSAGRTMKADVIREQLRRVAQIHGRLVDHLEVEELPGTGNGTQWRSRIRLSVDDLGRPGFHRHRSSSIVTDLSCPQVVSGAYDGVAEQHWTPGSEVHITVDSQGTRHVVEVAPAQVSKTGRRSVGRRGAAARRGAAGAPRREHAVVGSGRAIELVGDRSWELDATSFWQAHVGAAAAYSTLIAEWAQVHSGETAWDLYGGVGVFAAALAGPVGSDGRVVSVEFSRRAVADASAALADLANVTTLAGRVERMIDILPTPVKVVIVDPPRAGAGRGVIEALAAHGPKRIVHIGCDPASFARDVGLYEANGYRFDALRAFDAFPLSHHVECVGLFVKLSGG